MPWESINQSTQGWNQKRVYLIIPAFLLILFEWFVRWEISDETDVILSGDTSKICSEEYAAFLCRYHPAFSSIFSLESKWWHLTVVLSWLQLLTEIILHIIYLFCTLFHIKKSCLSWCNQCFIWWYMEHLILSFFFNARVFLPKLCYHPWLAADEDRVSHLLSHVVWWKKIRWYIENLFISLMLGYLMPNRFS